MSEARQRGQQAIDPEHLKSHGQERAYTLSRQAARPKRQPTPIYGDSIKKGDQEQWTLNSY